MLGNVTRFMEAIPFSLLHASALRLYSTLNGLKNDRSKGCTIWVAFGINPKKEGFGINPKKEGNSGKLL